MLWINFFAVAIEWFEDRTRFRKKMILSLVENYWNNQLGYLLKLAHSFIYGGLESSDFSLTSRNQCHLNFRHADFIRFSRENGRVGLDEAFFCCYNRGHLEEKLQTLRNLISTSLTGISFVLQKRVGMVSLWRGK